MQERRGGAHARGGIRGIGLAVHPPPVGHDPRGEPNRSGASAKLEQTIVVSPSAINGQDKAKVVSKTKHVMTMEFGLPGIRLEGPNSNPGLLKGDALIMMKLATSNQAPRALYETCWKLGESFSFKILKL